MDLHQNARLSFRCREALANKIMIERLTLNAAAAAFNVSRKTATRPRCLETLRFLPTHAVVAPLNRHEIIGLRPRGPVAQLDRAAVS